MRRMLMVHNRRRVRTKRYFCVGTSMLPTLRSALGQRHAAAPRSHLAMKKSHVLPFFRFLLLFALTAAALATTTARAQMPEITLSIAGQKLTAEVAASNPERMQGLMHRRMMPENSTVGRFHRQRWHHHQYRRQEAAKARRTPGGKAGALRAGDESRLVRQTRHQTRREN